MRGSALPFGLERLLWKYRTLAALRARREALESAGETCFEPAEALERKRLFRRVAREFPGALRELDSFPAARLEARAARIEDELRHLRGAAASPVHDAGADPRRDEPRRLGGRAVATVNDADIASRDDGVRGDVAPGEWASIVLDFHRTLREALMVKRWIARRLPRGGDIPEALVGDFTKRLDRMYRLRGERAGAAGSASRRRDEHAELLARHLRPPGGRVLPLVWARLEQRHGKARAELEEMIFGGATG